MGSISSLTALHDRFSETEGIAILSMLVSRYEIHVKEEPQFAHETFEERKTRLLAARPGVTLTCVCPSLYCFCS